MSLDYFEILHAIQYVSSHLGGHSIALDLQHLICLSANVLLLDCIFLLDSWLTANMFCRYSGASPVRALWRSINILYWTLVWKGSQWSSFRQSVVLSNCSLSKPLMQQYSVPFVGEIWCSLVDLGIWCWCSLDVTLPDHATGCGMPLLWIDITHFLS